MRITACALLLAATLPLHLSAQAQEKVLNIYNWSDYIGPEALKAFQAQTGIQIKYDVFDSPEALDSKLLTGGSGYDLVFPSSSGLARAVKAKAVQPIDHSGLALYSNLDPDLLGKLATSDPGNRYGVPYTWGTVGLGLNKEAVSKRLGADVPLNTLDLLFKPEYASKLKDCGIGVLDSPQEVISIALNTSATTPTATSRPTSKRCSNCSPRCSPTCGMSPPAGR